MQMQRQEMFAEVTEKCGAQQTCNNGSAVQSFASNYLVKKEDEWIFPFKRKHVKLNGVVIRDAL